MAFLKTLSMLFAMLIILKSGHVFEIVMQPILEQNTTEDCHHMTKQQRDAMLAQAEYEVDMELNVVDVEAVDYVRRLLRKEGFLALNPIINVTHIDITTVCHLNGSQGHCRCEENFVWSSENCLTYGSWDGITKDTCSCINNNLSNAQYCHSKTVSPTYDSQTIPEINTTENLNNPTKVFDVKMSVRLQKEYTLQLSNATSLEYKNLKSMIDPVLRKQYEVITGFVSVSVNQFRKGSIYTDYVVRTIRVDSEEIVKANQKLPQAMQPIAPVVDPVLAFYNSSTSMVTSDITYTGTTMTLRCGPPPENIDLGQIYDSEWRFGELILSNGGRTEIFTSGNMSILKVNSVILADIGLYNCALKGKAMDFYQEGVVTKAQIRQAPNVQLQSELNVKCTDGKTDFRPLDCCVQKPYKVKWFQGRMVLNSTFSNDLESYCITYNYWLQNCNGSQEVKLNFTCRVDNLPGYEMITTMNIFSTALDCNDTQYGTGRVGDRSVIGCDKGQEGSKIAVCDPTKQWKFERDTCILIKIKELLIDSEDLVAQEIPAFVVTLNQIVYQDKGQITNFSATTSAVVNILSTIASVSTTVNQTIMKDILKTVDVIIGDNARNSWLFLNANTTSNVSSELLGSLEILSDKLVGEFTIHTQRIILTRTSFNSLKIGLNSSIMINIPNTKLNNVFITTMALSSLNIVMPARNSTQLLNSTSSGKVLGNVINSAVVIVKINATIDNVTLSMKLNNSLALTPHCVFWNFTVLNNFGAWDDQGCKLVSDINNTVTCNCNHLTSFSVLMAPKVPSSPTLRKALDTITYVGIGISLASLLICLIIEGCVWKAITRNSTAFMRHVSIVNIALCLLIADMCFLIGTSLLQGKDYGMLMEVICSTATFFMHFFYLALFFWMLVSGLLLFYRTIMVFSHMSNITMLAIGFSLGYGCPLIIAGITIASTAPRHGYIMKDYACWLNWTETKALLALVIPALAIVFTNCIIIIVVLYKMLKRSAAYDVQTDDKHALVVITRCVIILTPLFGLTWSLGVGTMVSPANEEIHVAFVVFNSLQGFLILVFGPLYDSKVRLIMSRKSFTLISGSANDRYNKHAIFDD